jgi:hypothetical protein
VESASVVDLVDEAGKVGCNVLEGFVCHQIHGFDLECLHEALDLGVVVGIAAPAHGAGETVLLQDGAIVFGGILRPMSDLPPKPDIRMARITFVQLGAIRCAS